MNLPELHVVLLHYPVLNRHGNIVSTAVTNLDIHDIARSARTYGIRSYFIVTPLDAQIELVTRIMAHWKEGFGAVRFPTRMEAMERVRLSRSLDDAVASIQNDRTVSPVLISTCARNVGTISFRDMRKHLWNQPDVPHVVLFGTGFGLAPEVLNRSDHILEPIGVAADWNHLSVRAAAAITLDRLMGIQQVSCS
jgi:hypothetical protein